MAQYDVAAAPEARPGLPAVRTIGIADLKDALRKGLDDFWAMPTHAIFLCVIYPILGLLVARAVFGYAIEPLLYPLAAGFALIGPLAAIGLYELSRRREMGLPTGWEHTFDVVHSPSFRGIVALGLLLLVIFGTWVAVANALYVSFFGYHEPATLLEFLKRVVTTPEGYRLNVLGNLVGFLFAVVVLVISAVSFPLLLDRHATATQAMLTSVRSFARNPVTMMVWGLIVAVALLLGSLPLFIGLAFVLPVLGHATWHLYRKVVEPPLQPRPEYIAPPRTPRSAADFPVSLIPGARDEQR